ncbi:MAG: hypothetical protein MI807_22980 [Verrucomicrobiales bacterium]|nr:hypothetical protein [Verrucomicrobiales bacterium]
MKSFLCLLTALLFFPFPDSAAEEKSGTEKAEVQFHFETGPPAWKGERILLPPGFARDLGWKGVEEIRFAPGMFRADKPDFFSYVLVFVLEPEADISGDGLRKELLTYYAGLSKAVMAGAGQTVETDDFTVEIEKADGTKKDAPEAALEANAWTATLDWVEPFATKKRQTLHLEIHTWKHGDQPVVLSCVSPVDPGGDEEVWSALRKIRKTFRLE